MTLTVAPTRPPFRSNCRGKDCGKLVEFHVVSYQHRPKLGRDDPKWHPYNLAVDIGTGQLRTNQVSHYLTCPNADFFGGAERAVQFPSQPPAPPTPPQPRRRDGRLEGWV